MYSSLFPINMLPFYTLTFSSATLACLSTPIAHSSVGVRIASFTIYLTFRSQLVLVSVVSGNQLNLHSLFFALFLSSLSVLIATISGTLTI